MTEYYGYVLIPYKEIADNEDQLKEMLMDQYGRDIKVDIDLACRINKDEYLADMINERRKNES